LECKAVELLGVAAGLLVQLFGFYAEKTREIGVQDNGLAA
jgi:hypothetical protein